MSNNFLAALEYLTMKKGLSADQIAYKLNISRQCWFQRKRKPDFFRLNELKAAAKYFGVDIIITKDGNTHIDFEI